MQQMEVGEVVGWIYGYQLTYNGGHLHLLEHNWNSLLEKSDHIRQDKSSRPQTLNPKHVKTLLA
jgi:hypothetical protein